MDAFRQFWKAREEALIGMDDSDTLYDPDMDETELAEEIYAHVVAYYWFLHFQKIPGFRFLINRADPIDLADGGDKKFRRMMFHLVWKLTR